MRPLQNVLLLALLLVLPGRFLAQSVRWDPPGGQLGFNKVSQLSLVLENCEPDGDPQLPQVDGLQFGQPSTAVNQSFEFGTGRSGSRKTFSFVFPVRPNKRAPIIIPPFDIKTDKGTLKVPGVRYTVGDAPVGNSGLTINDIASATLEVPKKSVWAGEVFPVTFTMSVIHRYLSSVDPRIDWPSQPLIAEDWSKPDPVQTTVQGERRWVATSTTRAYAKEPGIFTTKPASLMVGIVVGTSGFGLFTNPNVEARQLESGPLELTVKPLPPAPPEFTGAVGQFNFTSKVVPLTATVGEPVTWTLELAGTGNWPDLSGLPQREVSNDFQVVQPKSKRTMKEGTLFEGTLTEDVVLVPTKAGTYRLPSVRFSYFDPASGTYKTVASEPVTVTITAASGPILPPASSGAPVQFSLNPTTTALTPPLPTAVTPVPPENLPREQLEKSATGFAPLLLRPLVLVCLLSAVLCPLLLWLTLAALRSRERDPQRTRREALAALRKTLAELRSSGTQRLAAPKPGEGGSALSVQLKVWQSETARLWTIPHAAPGAPLVHVSIQRHSLNATAWTKLWEEADRALHGRDAALPQDWLLRAEGAVQAVKVPGWNPLSLFAGRNLVPFLSALLVLSALSAPSEIRAEPAADAYRRGDFAAATSAWQQSVKSTPTDWAARHNLGLALAQQDRWAEAAAHWTSAFLLNARADTTRYDLNLGIQRSGLANPQLVELSRGEGRYQIARLASPGEWQLALVGAALLLAAALVLLLLQGYRRIGGWGKPTALTATLLAIALAGTATFSLHAYGQLAHPEAVFVWRATTLRSIPTEADTTQKTSPLSAGSIAVVEKTFFGWTKLTFPGGQSGWVRSEELIGLFNN